MERIERVNIPTILSQDILAGSTKDFLRFTPKDFLARFGLN